MDRARAFGLRNGMWIARARELCECLIVMPYEFSAYERIAERMYCAVFELSPHVIGMSVDECYADLTALPDPEAAAAGLRATIRERTGCPASIGLGPNRLLAQLATKRAKPDGLMRIELAEGRAWLREEPVERLPGCGRTFVSKLSAIGVVTCADLLSADVVKVQGAIGPAKATLFRAFAAGADSRKWEPRPERKSMGAQSSWGVRFHTLVEAETFVRKLSAEVAERLARQGLRGSQLTLKLWRAMEGAPDSARKGFMGHGMCDHVSRSITLPAPTSAAVAIAQEATKMLCAGIGPPDAP